MEPVKHFEWSLTILFFTYGALNLQVTAVMIFWMAIGSQLSDMLELFLEKFSVSEQTARYLSHSFLLPLFLLTLYWYIFPELNFLFFLGYSSGIHLIVDSYGGGEGIFLLYPLDDTFQLSAISKDKRKKFGSFIRSKLGHLVKAETNDDLAWFWILQFSSVILLSFSLVFYLL